MARKLKGFTLIEILTTVALIIAITGIVFIQINPIERIAKANNTKRVGDINALMNAVGQRIIDNEGFFETNCASGIIPSTLTEIGTEEGNYNIEPCLVPNYIQKIPKDPTNGTAEATGYYIKKDPVTSKITINAPNAELGEVISITK